MELMDNWVAEFFLRRQQNPRVNASPLLSSMNLVDSDDCVKLKTTSVLRDISNALIRGTVDEGMLDLLEILEKLLFQEHLLIMEPFKSAYCWTAVECTLRFMWPVIASDGFFGDALDRIWKKLIGMLKERQSDLVTDELLKWESDLNKALEDPKTYQKIRETNIRYNAITHLIQLLKEQWALFGCSTLESETRKMFLNRKDSPNASRNRGDNLSRVDETIDNVNEEDERRDGRNGSHGENSNDVEEMRGVQNPDGIDDMVNQQEQEHEPNLNEGDVTVARELKDLLLEIQGVIDLSTRQEQEPPNQSVDVTPQADEANHTETGGGEDHVEAEDSQGTSSSSSLRRVRPQLPTQPRRQMKFWSPEEVEALREGVKEYGKAWKDIKNANPAVFADRSEVDLKDKWRNLLGRNK